MSIERVSSQDLEQLQVTGTVSFGYNSENELIWITYVYAGKTYRQQVTDSNYTGGTTYGSITRTVKFGAWDKQ